MSTRRYSVVIGGALVLVLVGCSQTEGGLSEPVVGAGESRGNAGTGDTGAAGEVDGDAPAFHFQSGKLELGDFVYEDIKDDLFDPCAEISAEEFAATGFEADASSRELTHIEGLGCGIRNGDLSDLFSIVTSSGTKADRLAAGDVLDASASDTVPGLFTYQGNEVAGENCVAAVDTVRGQLSITAGEGFYPADRETLCDSATEIIEKLYKN